MSKDDIRLHPELAVHAVLGFARSIQSEVHIQVRGEGVRFATATGHSCITMMR